MTTEEPREPRADRPQPPVQPPQKRSDASTQVGQVIQELSRLTRRLPAADRGATTRALAHSRERVGTLIAALGDPTHHQHAAAVDDLAAIGAPAVAALCETLSADVPWLTAYRAAEALAQIGDGHAASALGHAALNHPNSNVRWGAVRALTEVGDARTIFVLRRVAQDDRGKTSWGEPVAGTAQSALDQMSANSPWRHSIELAKTALTCVLMIVALALAFSVVATLREEFSRIRAGIPAAGSQIVRPAPLLPTAAPTAFLPTPQPGAAAPPPDLIPTPTLNVTATPLPGGSDLVAGTVLQDANIRPIPSGAQNAPIGRLAANDEIIFLTISPDGQWYRVKLGERYSSTSSIASPDGTGWISKTLVSPPPGFVPPEQVVLPTPVPTRAP